jgi:hypothetical protein
MTATGFCCGQIPKRKKILKEKDLPDNPAVTSGVEVIYVGAGSIEIKGKASGLLYYASGHKRRFKADPNDVAHIIKSGDFILNP